MTNVSSECSSNNLWDTGEDDSWKVYTKWMQGLIVWDELRLLTGPVIELSPALLRCQSTLNNQSVPFLFKCDLQWEHGCISYQEILIFPRSYILDNINSFQIFSFLSFSLEIMPAVRQRWINHPQGRTRMVFSYTCSRTADWTPLVPGALPRGFKSFAARPRL